MCTEGSAGPTTTPHRTTHDRTADVATLPTPVVSPTGSRDPQGVLPGARRATEAVLERKGAGHRVALEPYRSGSPAGRGERRGQGRHRRCHAPRPGRRSRLSDARRHPCSAGHPGRRSRTPGAPAESPGSDARRRLPAPGGQARRKLPRPRLVGGAWRAVGLAGRRRVPRRRDVCRARATRSGATPCTGASGSTRRTRARRRTGSASSPTRSGSASSSCSPAARTRP